MSISDDWEDDGPPLLIRMEDFGRFNCDYVHRSCAEIPGIPPNWHESWDILRATLQTLEEQGMDPQAAVMGLLHVEIKREEVNSLDASSLAHLTEHLGTNYVPGLESVERAQIQEFCANGLQKISKVSTEMKMDDERLRWSTGRHATLCGIVDPYLALISSMRALPTEILQEIFIACLPARHNAVMHITQAPLLLGRVCSSWRRITLSTAALWSSVHVVVPYPEYPISDDALNPVVSQLCEVLGRWLKGSGACPLSISLFAISRLCGGKRVLMDVIVPYSRRWRILKLTHDDILVLRDLPPEKVPLLEALEIVDTNWDEPHLDSLRFLSVPPNLRSISLKYSNGYVPIPLCSWERITTLCLESQMSFFTLDLEQVVEILGQCSNLRICRLTFPIFRDDLAASATSAARHITLPQLRVLAVTAELALDGTFNMANILAPLVLPSLQELAVIHLPSQGAEDRVALDMLLALDELVARSSCVLKVLQIGHAIGDVDNLLRCLRRLPGLTRLDVDHRPLYLSGDPELMPLITALIPSLSESTPVLCPHLLHLRLIHCDTTDACHPVLQTLVETRCQPPAERSTWLRTAHLVLDLKCPSTLNGPQISMDMYPSHVQITEPVEYNHRQPTHWTYRWQGIPAEEIEDLSVLS
ncbi:hypothetical protein C8R44DRAFT_807373, partial [Mycena epipterygia]